MRLTESVLKQIIKEELRKVLEEQAPQAPMPKAQRSFPTPGTKPGDADNAPTAVTPEAVNYGLKELANSLNGKKIDNFPVKAVLTEVKNYFGSEPVVEVTIVTANNNNPVYHLRGGIGQSNNQPYLTIQWAKYGQNPVGNSAAGGGLSNLGTGVIGKASVDKVLNHIKQHIDKYLIRDIRAPQ